MKEPVETKTDGEKKESKKTKGSSPHLLKQQQALFCSRNNGAEAEVEVFNSASLVKLVKIMHPYCLKLHVEEGEHLRRHHAFFGQEQVWKYERPTEESNEDINVVSDDDVRPEDKKVLRSVLLKDKSQRKRKRVSFGPVQVASFEESDVDEKNQKITPSDEDHVSKAVTGSSQEPQNLSPVLTLKVQKKSKSLSLQQYRQRQQARSALAEQSGNYSARWPSVSETPQELSPILSFQGQSRGPTTRGPKTRLDHSRVKWSRPGSRISSPLGLLPAMTRHPSVATKRRRLANPALVSSDPPNPVVLPPPVSQTGAIVDSSRQSPAESSGPSPQQPLSSPGPRSETQDCPPWLNERPSGISSTSSAPRPNPTLPESDQDTPQVCSLEAPLFNHAAAAEEERPAAPSDRKWRCGSDRALRGTPAASGKHA